MTLVTLRPNGTLSGWGSTTLTGAASIQVALSDDSDASYVEGGGWTNFQMGKLNLGTSTVPAGGLFKSLRVRVRARAVSGTSNVRVFGYVPIVGATRASVLSQFDSALTTTIATTGGPTEATSLTQEQIDALQIWVGATAAPTNGTNIRILEVYFDFRYATQPTVSVTGPTGTIAQSKPVTVWDYVQGDDGGPQSHFQVKIFTSAVYGGGGFDPETSAAVYDSGEVASSNTEHKGATTVPDAVSYRSYVKVAQTINGEIHWSAWANTTYTVAVAPPTITSVVPVSTGSGIQVTVSRSGTAWSTVSVERSFDIGTTWEFVRGASSATITNPFATFGASTFVVLDTEVPNGTSVLYRAQAMTATAGNWSSWMNSSATSWSSAGTIWLRSVVNPTNQARVYVTERPTASRSRRQGVFQVLGRTTPVVSYELQSARTGSITFQTVTITEQTALETILAEGVQLMQFPPAWGFRDLWMVSGDSSDSWLGGEVETILARHWDVPYIEVSRPPDAWAPLSDLD